MQQATMNDGKQEKNGLWQLSADNFVGYSPFGCNDADTGLFPLPLSEFPLYDVNSWDSRPKAISSTGLTFRSRYEKLESLRLETGEADVCRGSRTTGGAVIIKEFKKDIITPIRFLTGLQAKYTVQPHPNVVSTLDWYAELGLDGLQHFTEVMERMDHDLFEVTLRYGMTMSV
jgi:hypothetical protein